MSFFKDFKADFTQAMNELMPDGNEMYDEDELIEDESVDIVEEPPKKAKKMKEKPVKEKVAKEKPAKEKKMTRPKKKKDEQESLVQAITDEEVLIDAEAIVDGASVADNEPLAENLDVEELLKSLESAKLVDGLDVEDTMIAEEDVVEEVSDSVPEIIVDVQEQEDVQITESKKSVAKKASTEEEIQADDMEIAPEDMLVQIDDLLDKELYGEEEEAQLLLDDDMEVNTMDMSVEEMLNQLVMKQSATEQTASVEETENASNNMHDEPTMPIENNVSATDDTQELSVDDLLSQLEATTSEVGKEESEITAEEVTEEIETVMDEETEEELEAIAEEAPEEIEVVIEEESEEEPETAIEEAPEEIKAVIEEESEEELETAIEAVTEEVIEEIEPVIEAEPEEEQETTAQEVAEEIEMDTEEGTEDETEDEIEATLLETAMEIEAIMEAEADEKSTEEVVVESVSEEEASLDDLLEQLEENRTESVEDNIMAQKKDVISINSTEEAKDAKEETKAVEEKIFNVEDADAETTYITKGTKIKGDLETDGSIDIIGVVEGSVICKGKVVVGGNVVGNITAGELYANSARIEGCVKSYGSVKVGVGTMIIGGIEGESAVIAGAVNGDIDVKGPVIVDSTAVIMGNIKSRSVQINNGAVIEGFCSQSYSDIDVKSFFA